MVKLIEAIDTCELICFFHQTLYSFRARGKWRETVTGDHNKRIRDYMKETPQVKMLDKFSFTLGNLNIFSLGTRLYPPPAEI